MSDLAAEMKSHALEAQKFSRKHLVLELDFSPHSIHELEQQFDAVDYAVRGGKSPENIAMLTRVWGAYLGESLRTRFGGSWSQEDDSRLVLTIGNERLRPHEQVRQRLLAGAQYNIETYYQDLQTRLSQSEK